MFREGKFDMSASFLCTIIICDSYKNINNPNEKP